MDLEWRFTDIERSLKRDSIETRHAVELGVEYTELERKVTELERRFVKTRSTEPERMFAELELKCVDTQFTRIMHRYKELERRFAELERKLAESTKLETRLKDLRWGSQCTGGTMKLKELERRFAELDESIPGLPSSGEVGYLRRIENYLRKLFSV